jgi:hypothetical protein
MKKIFLALVIAFAFTTAMAVTTVVAHTDSVFRLGIREPFGKFVTATKFQPTRFDVAMNRA